MDFDLTEIDRLPVVKVPIHSLKTSGSPRSSGENTRHVRTLAEVREGLPPITVHRETMRVIDGMHRLRAAEMRGEREIEARFFEGSEDSSFVLAVKLNVTHGLPLSLADRKVAVARILRLHPEWSDRLVASITGVAPKTAAAVRARGAADNERPGRQGANSDMRVGRDGRHRPQNVRERRGLAAKLLRENPSASLRQIAEQAGVSPETVRSVRATVVIDSRTAANDTEASDSGIPPRRSLPRARSYSPLSGDGEKPALDFLRADPAFRSTDVGRSLLRLLCFPELSSRHGETLIAQIPPHCADRVIAAALECASAWSAFALEVKSARNLAEANGCTGSSALAVSSRR